MIGAFTPAPAPPRRFIVDPGLLSTRDRAALRILLYPADVATTSQLTTLAARTTLGALLADATSRRCPTPVGTDAWFQVLGLGGSEDFMEALR